MREPPAFPVPRCLMVDCFRLRCEKDQNALSSQSARDRSSVQNYESWAIASATDFAVFASTVFAR